MSELVTWMYGKPVTDTYTMATRFGKNNKTLVGQIDKRLARGKNPVTFAVKGECKAKNGKMVKIFFIDQPLFESLCDRAKNNNTILFYQTKKEFDEAFRKAKEEKHEEYKLSKRERNCTACFYVMSGSRIMSYSISGERACNEADKLIRNGATKITVYQPGSYDLTDYVWNNEIESVTLRKRHFESSKELTDGERKAIQKAVQIELSRMKKE